MGYTNEYHMCNDYNHVIMNTSSKLYSTMLKIRYIAIHIPAIYTPNILTYHTAGKFGGRGGVW